jgi:hypothetical protein
MSDILLSSSKVSFSFFFVSDGLIEIRIKIRKIRLVNESFKSCAQIMMLALGMGCHFVDHVWEGIRKSFRNLNLNLLQLEKFQSKLSSSTYLGELLT